VLSPGFRCARPIIPFSQGVNARKKFHTFSEAIWGYPVRIGAPSRNSRVGQQFRARAAAPSALDRPHQRNSTRRDREGKRFVQPQSWQIASIHSARDAVRFERAHSGKSEQEQLSAQAAPPKRGRQTEVDQLDHV
jgi:hypothetical protein